MPLVTARTSATQLTENRVKRYLDEDAYLLEPNEQALITFLANLRKKNNQKPIKTVKPEWMERDYIPRWTAVPGGATNVATTITLADGTTVVAGDVLLSPTAVTSAAQPELILVSSVAGNVATVVRGFAGTTGAAIAANAQLAIIGTAFEEGSGVPSQKRTTPVPFYTYTQIFKKSVVLTKTAAAQDVYYGPNGDRETEHNILMKEMKADMNRAFLFGKLGETTGSQGFPLRTTMGLHSRIQTNKLDAGGLLTQSTIEAFDRMCFRYGSRKKLLLAPAIVKSALWRWATSNQLFKSEETVFGVDITRIKTATGGEWLVALDWMLEDGAAGIPGFSSIAFSIDLDFIKHYDLAGRGLALEQDVVKDGADRTVDELKCECAQQIKHERYHAMMFNVTSYS